MLQGDPGEKLTLEQRKRVLLLACACDRLDLTLVARRGENAVGSMAVRGTSLWQIARFLGRAAFSRFLRGRRGTGLGHWLRLIPELATLFL